MAGGGSIKITVPVKLNVIGLEELKKASTMIKQLKSEAANIKVGLNVAGVSGKGMSPKESAAASKASSALQSNQKRAANLSKTVSKDFLELAKSTRTLIAEMNNASSKMSKAQADSDGVSGTTGKGSGGKKSKGGGYFGSQARGDRGGGFGSRLKSVAEFGVAAKVFQAGVNTLAKIPETIVGVDAELKELNKVLATSGKNLENLRKAAAATGTEFGNSITTVLKGFKVFAQQGLKQEEVIERGRAVSLAENVSTLSTDEAAETVTAGLKVFGDQVGNSAERLIDSFVMVESSNAVTAADLSEVVKRVGIAAKNAGTSFDELNAFTTVIQESTRAGGGRISRSLRFTFKNLFDQARQGDLQQIGVNTRTSGGDLRDATDVLGDIAKKWNILTRAQKRNIAVNIGGTRFQNEFNALMEGFGKVSTVAAQSQGAAGTASQRNAIIMQSLQKRAAKVGVAFEGLAASVGGGVSGPISAALTSAEKLLTVLTSISETEFPGLKALQGAFGTAESEQTGTVGDIVGSASTSLIIGSLISKGITKAIPKSGGLLTKLLVGSQIASGPFSRISDKSRGLAGGFAGARGVLPKLGGLFTKIPKIGPLLARFGTHIAVAAPALATFGSTLLSVLAPLAALAAIVGVATFAFKRLTETSEERDQRTGLNAERDFVKQRSQQIQALEKEIDNIDFQRKEIQEGNTALSPEEATKALKSLQDRETKVQEDFRDILIDSQDRKGVTGLSDRLPLQTTQRESGREDFTRGNVPITGPNADLESDSQQAQKSREQLNKTIRDAAKQDRRSERQLDLEKALSSFGEQSFSAQATQFRTALDAAQARGGLTGEGDFLNRWTGGLLGTRGVTRAERDVLLNPELQKLTRQELNRDIKNPFLDAIREGGEEGFKQYTKKAAKLAEEGSFELGTSRKDSQLQRGLDALVENRVVSSAGKLQRQDVERDIRKEFLKSIGREDERVLVPRGGFTGGGRMASLADVEDNEVFRSQQFRDFQQQLLGRQAIGPEIQKLTSGAVDALKASGSSAIDLSSRLRDRDGNLLQGKELESALKDFKDTAVFRFKDSGDVVTKIGNSLLKATDDGGADIVSGITDSGFIEALKNGAIELLSFNQKLQEAGSIAKNTALTGFGAGERLDIKDFQSGPTSLQDLSDQQAGAFVEIGKSGAVFNKGLQQFLNAARERQDELEQQDKAGELTKTDQKELAAFSIIGKAAETFGIAAKSIETAARNMERFQRERSNREASPVSITEDQLFPGGFAKLNLGRDQSQLSPLERAQQRLRPQALRLEELQFGAGQDQATLNSIDEASARLGEFISSISSQNVGSLDVGKIEEVFSRVGGFDTESVAENIKTILEQVISRGESDTTEGQAEEVRGKLFGLFSKLLTSRRKKVTDRIDQRKPEQLQLENLFKIEAAFESVAKAAQDAELSFQNAKESAGGIDQALSTAFKAQGAGASRLFTGKRGASVDQLSQVRGLERLNEFERARREASLLSSKAVQQGRVQVFDENRQRVAPISREEANARIQDSRLNEKRAKALEKQQRQEQLFSGRKGQLEQVLGQVRQVQQLDLGESFKKAIGNVEQSLVSVQQRKATSFFSRSGRFNESSFNALLNVSSNLEKELAKVGGSKSIRTSELNVDQALAAREFIGKEKAAEAVRNQVEQGGATPEQIAKAVADGVISKEEGADFQAALNQQTYSPITSKLDIIASILSTMAALMGANGEVDNTLKEAATKAANDPKAEKPKKGEITKTDKGSSKSDTQSAVTKSLQQFKNDLTKSTTGSAGSSYPVIPKDLAAMTDDQIAFFTGKDSFTMPKGGEDKDSKESILDLVKAGKTITNEDLAKLSSVSKSSGGYRSLVSDDMFSRSFGKTNEKNERLGRTAETDKQAVKNLLSSSQRIPDAKTLLSAMQPDSDITRQDLFGPNKSLTSKPGIETIQDKQGQTIRGTKISDFEAQRMIDKANNIDSLTGGKGPRGSELDRLKQRFGGELPKAGDFMSLDANPFPGTGFSPFAKQGPDGRAIPISGGEIFRDPLGTSESRGIEPSGASRSESAMDGAVQKIQKAGDSLAKLAEATNRTSTALDAKSQKSQNQQEENTNHLKKTATATQEQADLSHGRSVPANREQASRNQGRDIDVAAIADACRQGTAEGSREGCEEGSRTGTEAGAQAFERVASNLSSSDGSVGGERFDALEELVVTGFQERDSSIVALQSRQEQQEEEIMSSISDVSTRVELVDAKSEENRSSVESTNQRITDSETRVNDLETSMAEGAQPLEEARQKADDAFAIANAARDDAASVRSKTEEQEAHLASIEGRIVFSGD